MTDDEREAAIRERLGVYSDARQIETAWLLARLDAERARAAALEAALRRLTGHLPDYWEDVADARRLLGEG